MIPIPSGTRLPISEFNWLYGSIIYQCIYILTSMGCFGVSKHEAKKCNHYKMLPFMIFPTNTMNRYIAVCCKFVKWAKEEYGCKKVAYAYRYVDEYLQMRIALKLSPWTIHTEASALAKLYGCSTKDFGVELPIRERKNSRRNSFHDDRFAMEKHRGLYIFCICTGLRRREIQGLDVDRVTLNAEGKAAIEVLNGKGGKARTVIALSDEPYRIAQEAKAAGTKKMFSRIPPYARTHFWRKQYAAELYTQIACPLDTLTKKEKYYCRKELTGVVLDRAAMLYVSHMLGHEREDVFTNYLLIKPSDPCCSEKM